MVQCTFARSTAKRNTMKPSVARYQSAGSFGQFTWLRVRQTEIESERGEPLSSPVSDLTST